MRVGARGLSAWPALHRRRCRRRPSVSGRPRVISSARGRRKGLQRCRHGEADETGPARGRRPCPTAAPRPRNRAIRRCRRPCRTCPCGRPAVAPAASGRTHCASSTSLIGRSLKRGSPAPARAAAPCAPGSGVRARRDAPRCRRKQERAAGGANPERDGHGVVALVADRDGDAAHAQLLGAPGGSSMELHGRRAGRQPQDLDLGPADATDAQAEDLRHGLLGRPAAGEVLGPVADVALLVLGQDALRKAIAVLLERRGDALDLDDVDAQLGRALGNGRQSPPR